MSNYEWYSDPGHAWLKVPVREVLQSRVKISDCSYVGFEGRELYAYLEEDCDAGAFLRAVNRLEEEFPRYVNNKKSFIRKLHRFTEVVRQPEDDDTKSDQAAGLRRAVAERDA